MWGALEKERGGPRQHAFINSFDVSIKLVVLGVVLWQLKVLQIHTELRVLM